ncbi:hypothetical protein ACNVED_14090 [Legionella sp. D16C41]|uniref:hypothetical protein n=1 Tax=Legionella sp. D16C41 TaxID=3402688 RepID=UPI003AF51123
MNNKKEDGARKAPWTAKAKFILLAIAGAIFFGCQGFDDISTLLTATSLPTMIAFAVGLACSVISIALFYAFDLWEVSKNLGVNFKSAPKLIDNYLKKVQYIKNISGNLRNNILYKKKLNEIESDIALIKLLIQMYNDLDIERKALRISLERPALKVGKIVVASITGIFFFSGGFCAGQTVASAIAGLVTTAVTGTFWPILIASVFVGLMALAVYWFVERPGIENLIGSWFGLDREKIDELCDPELVKKDKAKLKYLEEMFIARKQEISELQATQQAFKVLGTEYSRLQRNLANCRTQPVVNHSLEENKLYELSNNFELDSSDESRFLFLNDLSHPSSQRREVEIVSSRIGQQEFYTNGAIRYSMFTASASGNNDNSADVSLEYLAAKDLPSNHPSILNN